LYERDPEFFALDDAEFEGFHQRPGSQIRTIVGCPGHCRAFLAQLGYFRFSRLELSIGGD
jgi:hypothetical protein